MGELRLDELTKVFDDSGKEIVAVNELDLTVRDGEFLVLVGPSGCGKSTTLRCIAGLERVSTGRIRLDGRDITDAKPKERDMAMVFQNYALYPHMTVRKNIGYGLKITTDLSDDEIRDRVESTAELLEIDELLEKKPKELSGGQQQRVALGRAIIREPEVFLMDEPLSNLDAKLRTQTRTEIQQLQQEMSVTTIYVTHDQTEAMTMGDRIAILNEGELQQVAPPEECYDRPNNEFVAGFIGSPSMNFFDITVTPAADGVEVSSPGFQTVLPTDLERGDYTLGVRPEDFVVADDDRHIDTVVDVVEPMGSDNFLYLMTEASDREVTARVGSEFRPERGDHISLGFDIDDVHIFDSDGERVPTGDEQTVVDAP